MKELMNKGRKMYESYWAFETEKWLSELKSTVSIGKLLISSGKTLSW